MWLNTNTVSGQSEANSQTPYGAPVSESGTASSYIFISRTLTGTNTINTRKKGLSEIRLLMFISAIMEKL